MPLSDHEQRLLEQMERALYAEDPKFADSLRKTRRPAVDRKRIALGLVGAVAGLAVLLAGVATQIVALGVLGFVAMLGCAVLAYSAFMAKPASETSTAAAGPAAPAGAPAQAPRPASQKKPRSKQPGGFMERLEERWRKRREDRGGQY